MIEPTLIAFQISRKMKINLPIHLTIKYKNHPNLRTKKKGDNSWRYDISCGWKQGLKWGEKGKYVKQTMEVMNSTGVAH